MTSKASGKVSAYCHALPGRLFLSIGGANRFSYHGTYSDMCNPEGIRSPRRVDQSAKRANMTNKGCGKVSALCHALPGRLLLSMGMANRFSNCRSYSDMCNPAGIRSPRCVAHSGIRANMTNQVCGEGKGPCHTLPGRLLLSTDVANRPSNHRSYSDMCNPEGIRSPDVSTNTGRTLRSTSTSLPAKAR